VRSLRGFTLIELMVTIAVLAILMMLAAPSFADFFQRYRLRGAADEVASLLVTARTEAMTRNRDVAVVFKGTDAAWCVGAVAAAEPATLGDAVGAAPDCDCAGGCMIGGRVTEAHGSNYSGVARVATPASFVFDRLTGAVKPLSAAGRTSFKSPNQKYTLAVDVSPLGRGQLCVPGGEPAMSGFPTCGAN
jgi:type IV fimbrial biogenesis protein FimT